MSTRRLTFVGFGLAVLLARTLASAGATTPAVLARVGTAQWLLARAAKPWLPAFDPKTDWNFTHASQQVRQACLRSATVPIPRADLPTLAQLPKLASCNSEALYYGFTAKPDAVRARQCAYLERAVGNRKPIGGSAVLSMIYANGMGVKRNLRLARKFACEAGGAPAEIDARIEHLKTLAKMTPPPKRPFDVCDDITSGYMEGVCTGVAATYRDIRREKAIARIASGYTPAQRSAFSALGSAAAKYINAHARNEVDLTGTGRGAFWIDDIEHGWNEFLRNLQTLEAGQLPAANAAAAHQAQVHLEALYDRVLAQPDLRARPPRQFPPPGIPVIGGTMSRQGFRTDESLWLSYRDAWVHFAAALKPAVSASTVRTWITRERTRDLSCRLATHPPDDPACLDPPPAPPNLGR